MTKTHAPKFMTPYRFNLKDQHKEHPKGASDTIPDQAQSVKELLDKIKQNRPISGSREPIYYGEDVIMPNMAKLDLIDQAELIEQQKNIVTEIGDELRSKDNERKTKKQQELFDKKVKDELEKISKTPKEE